MSKVRREGQAINIALKRLAVAIADNDYATKHYAAADYCEACNEFIVDPDTVTSIQHTCPCTGMVVCADCWDKLAKGENPNVALRHFRAIPIPKDTIVKVTL